MQSPPLMLGWREWVGLPGLGLPAVKAKVDTGARTSALHAFEVDVEHRAGVDIARFAVHPLQQRNDVVVRCEAPVVERRVVTDSGGHRELRLVIETEVEVAGRRWPIELTLTDRDTMRFRMLLGRTALAGRAGVDPQASYVTGKRRHPEAFYDAREGRSGDKP